MMIRGSTPPLPPSTSKGSEVHAHPKEPYISMYLNEMRATLIDNCSKSVVSLTAVVFSLIAV